MAKRADPRAAATGSRSNGTGTCRVYGSGGEVLWEREGFVVGSDRVPRRLSLVMLAMQVVDPKTGERLVKWDPLRMLGG